MSTEKEAARYERFENESLRAERRGDFSLRSSFGRIFRILGAFAGERKREKEIPQLEPFLVPRIPESSRKGCLFSRIGDGRDGDA